MVLILFVGLALDVARLFLAVNQLHNAADAGSLAGAQYVKFDQTTAHDLTIATAYENYADGLPVFLRPNPGNDPTLDVVLGRWIRQTGEFIPTTDMPNAVKAVARRDGSDAQSPPVSLLFMPIAKIYTQNVGRHAIARSIVTMGAALITLAANPNWTHGPTGLWIHGTGTIEITGGDIQVNSVADSGQGQWQALRGSGTSLTLECGEIHVVGASEPPPEDPRWEEFYGTIPFSVTNDADRVEDPLGHLSPPAIPEKTSFGDQTITSETIFTHGETITDPISGTQCKLLTLEPGYYPGGISLNQRTWTEVLGTDPVTGEPIYGETYVLELELSSGLYALAGGTSTSGDSGLCMTGGSLVGEGVTLYITGDPTANVAYGEVDIGGSISVRLTSPGDQYPNDLIGTDGADGVVMWQDPLNTSPARIIGSSGLHLAGTLYFKNNHAEIGGGGYQAGNQIIAASVDLHGTGRIGVPYDGRNFKIAFRSVLVQ
jgi:hypothetical protein